MVPATRWPMKRTLIDVVPQLVKAGATKPTAKLQEALAQYEASVITVQAWTSLLHDKPATMRATLRRSR